MKVLIVEFRSRKLKEMMCLLQYVENYNNINFDTSPYIQGYKVTHFEIILKSCLCYDIYYCHRVEMKLI